MRIVEEDNPKLNEDRTEESSEEEGIDMEWGAMNTWREIGSMWLEEMDVRAMERRWRADE